MTTVLTLLLLFAVAGPVVAADSVDQTFPVPVDRVWSVTLAVLKQLGWDIDKSDRSIGWITTDSRSVDGENYGVYAKGTRHRLVVRVKESGPNRTVVSIERSLFKRERILFIDKDEPVTTTDQSVEKSVLKALEKSF